MARTGEISADAWKDLTFITAPQCTCCGLPFDYTLPEETSHATEKESLLCGDCLAHPKPYHAARAVFAYNDASRALILGFKHGDKTHLAVALGKFMASTGKDSLVTADALVPVPLHWRRLLARRYNQAALLAWECHRLTHTPCWPDTLKRIKHTPPQGHKNAKDRHENVKNVFALNPAYSAKIKDKKLVLIDDVHTTGATLEACTKILGEAGAAQVDILTLARVTRQN